MYVGASIAAQQFAAGRVDVIDDFDSHVGAVHREFAHDRRTIEKRLCTDKR